MRDNAFACIGFLRGGGGGGGMTTYIFLIRMYPVKTEGEPKAWAGFLTNYQPKSGAKHMCYKNATQSRGNLVSVQIDILFGEKPAEKMDRGQYMSQRRGDFFILNENPTQCRGLADFVNPLPGGGGILIHSLTRVTPPPPPSVSFLGLLPSPPPLGFLPRSPS